MMLRSLLLPLMTFLCLTLSAAANDERILDDFQEGLSDGGQAIATPWKSSGGNSLLSTTLCDGKKYLQVAVPFQNHSEWERVYIDRDIDLDLRDVSKFILDVEIEDLQPLGSVTLYFRSKGGWYSCYSGFSRQGRQKLEFTKDNYRAEGSPAGWDKINGIRIAFWQGQSKNGNVILHRLSLPKPSALIVTGGTTVKEKNPKEAKHAEETAEYVAALAARAQIEANRIDETTLSDIDLSRYKLVVLPYNPKLSAAAQDQLVKYVEGGGKLWVCYRLPPKLAKVIGFQPGQWMRASREGGFASIHFVPDSSLPGLPEVVEQRSWNINTAKPVDYNAKVVGTWFDDAGKSTGEPALLVSDRGAYLSHILLKDDPQSKVQMLEAIVGKFSPELWKDLAEKQLESLVEIGHDSPTQTEAWIKSQAVPRAIAELEKGKQLEIKARQLLQNKDTAAEGYYHILDVAKEACQAKKRAYVLSQRSPKPGQRRGFWNHSGTGAYPGDWDRTMREMSEAGFNTVFPNMCWGGCAHYASDVLPRSKTYEKYGDQIKQAVAAGKKYGVEVHVWKVNHYLSPRSPREFVEKLRREGRLAKSATGEELDWLCPSNLKNFELERDAMLEIPKKYDVDGIHFDYIRYKSDEYCYCDGCRKRFEAATGKKVENWPQDCYSGERKQEYRDWRCGNITRLVKAVHEGVQKINPKVKVSAAVFQDHPSCKKSVAQDWLLWAKSGYVDFLCPMDYQPNELSFENIVARQLKQVDGAVPLCPGIGVSTAQPRMDPERTATQIFLTERLGAAGFTIFNLSEREAENLFPAFKEAQER